MRSPTLGALKQFDEGRKHLLLEAVGVLEKRGQWEAVFEFCLHALEKKEEDGSPSFLAADWSVWRRFIKAAGKLPNQEESVYHLAVRETGLTCTVTDMMPRIEPLAEWSNYWAHL